MKRGYEFREQSFDLGRLVFRRPLGSVDDKRFNWPLRRFQFQAEWPRSQSVPLPASGPDTVSRTS